jgi:hypothetical protein
MPVPDRDKPMILYKYLSVEKADEWLIGEHSILLTPPLYLNDLLEFRVRREPADAEERRAMFEEFQRDRPSNLTFEEFNRAITSNEHMDGEGEDMRRGLSEAVGVVSLTSDPVNELMWAHYGLNTGVAIGYRSSDVTERNGLRGRSLSLGLALEVNYTNEVFLLKRDFSDAALHLSTKRICWVYEKEWRIVEGLQEARIIARGDKNFYTLPAQRDQIAMWCSVPMRNRLSLRG